MSSTFNQFQYKNTQAFTPAAPTPKFSPSSQPPSPPKQKQFLDIFMEEIQKSGVGINMHESQTNQKKQGNYETDSNHELNESIIIGNGQSSPVKTLKNYNMFEQSEDSGKVSWGISHHLSHKNGDKKQRFDGVKDELRQLKSGLYMLRRYIEQSAQLLSENMKRMKKAVIKAQTSKGRQKWMQNCWEGKQKADMNMNRIVLKLQEQIAQKQQKITVLTQELSYIKTENWELNQKLFDLNQRITQWELQSERGHSQQSMKIIPKERYQQIGNTIRDREQIQINQKYYQYGTDEILKKAQSQVNLKKQHHSYHNASANSPSSYARQFEQNQQYQTNQQTPNIQTNFYKGMRQKHFEKRVQRLNIQGSPERNFLTFRKSSGFDQQLAKNEDAQQHLSLALLNCQSKSKQKSQPKSPKFQNSFNSRLPFPQQASHFSTKQSPATLSTPYIPPLKLTPKNQNQRPSFKHSQQFMNVPQKRDKAYDNAKIDELGARIDQLRNEIKKEINASK